MAKKIDFSRISRSNAHEIFSNLTVEDIQEICTKSNGKIQEICLQWGYSYFIKVLIKGWYLVNKENPSRFEEIFALTGGMLYDVFLEILKDEKIDNINDVLHLLAQYHVLEDEENYENILDLLNKKVGNEFYKEQYKKQKQDENERMLFLNENVLEGLSKLNCTNEDLQKILYIYNNPVSKIDSEHVLDILDILEKIDYSVLSENDLNNLFGLKIALVGCITYQMYNKKRDLGLLIKIQKLPRVIMERIEYCMFIDNFDICDDVGEAIDTLKKYGYIVENKNEILDCIQSSKYRDIKVVPSLNSVALYAFMAENNKTKILLSTCINQFLEDDNPDFFKEEENINTCLMLLDFSNQILLDMSDETIKRICSIMQRKLATSNEISSGDREILENGIKRNIKRLENRKSLSKLSNFFNSGPEEDYELCISIHDYFLKQELTEQQANDIITFF